MPGNGFLALEGTSMAAPHVAGAFAVLRHAHSSATVNEIESAFKSVGPVVTSYSGYKRRRLDVTSALTEITSKDPSVFIVPILDLLLLD